jgi:uncharacterized protein (TIGR02246 family)
MKNKFWNTFARIGYQSLFGLMGLTLLIPAVSAQQTPPAATPAPAAPAAAAAEDIMTAAEARSVGFAKAFDAAKVDELANLFATDAEFVDEEGNIYQGKAEIQALFTSFFEKFPGAKLKTEVDSIRPLGTNMLVEEGTRMIEAADASSTANLRYLMVLTKEGADWKISMIREFAQDAPATQLDYLMPLSLLEGEWVDENPDGATRVHYHWNEEKTFLLGEYTVQINGRPAMKSSQRLGWDPVQQKIRSWTFDADGGFSEGFWTPTENGWIVKSTATLPSGEIGSATLTLTLLDDDRISVSSRDRVIGNIVEEPFEIQIVRRPPTPTK